MTFEDFKRDILGKNTGKSNSGFEKIKQIIEEIEKRRKSTNPEDKVPCSCPDCKFDTFERLYPPGSGTFHYHNFELGGNKMQVKYWTSNTDSDADDMIIKRVREKQAEPEETEESLRIKLNEAIRSHNYDLADVYINKIRNLNQNQKSK